MYKPSRNSANILAFSEQMSPNTFRSYISTKHSYFRHFAPDILFVDVYVLS